MLVLRQSARQFIQKHISHTLCLKVRAMPAPQLPWVLQASSQVSIHGLHLIDESQAVILLRINADPSGASKRSPGTSCTVFFSGRGTRGGREVAPCA